MPVKIIGMIGVAPPSGEATLHVSAASIRSTMRQNSEES